ncbi:high affinity immunoglobulin gamma Fc receptor I-like [Triplophysa rosa]|uniref:FcRI n=1 Tax=Triplophysa rosa TaxID=992332 RepID=A0A9W7TPG8_TRIRA|nr:high affinity immunoglobulin gamma Fc receptor I-like [Triplophysa rosa]KAI7800426.1 FcRI precursor [Triplophysa rosa]
MILLHCFCAPILASITVSKGSVRVFSGDDLRTACSVPDDPSQRWRYRWFRDEQDMGFYNSSEAWIKHSGNYSCQAERDMKKWPYILSTLPSPPLQLHVDRGWALLQTPVTPPIIDDTVMLTCHIRGNPVATEVRFYKDGSEIHCYESKELVFSKVTLEDAGVYWCRDSWMEKYELHSAQSLPVPVTVLDKLETPRLVVDSGRVIAGRLVCIKCEMRLNVKAEGLQIEYHYMKNHTRLAPASSSNTYTI